MTPRGIPTKYNGRQFRSRLEARWARFFDLAGWKYEYEPFDLKGWIPDFLLLGATPVLVEVKPVYVFPRYIAEEMECAGAPEGHELLIVGCTIPLAAYETQLGWLQDEFSGEWAEAVLGRWTLGNGKLGFCHAHQAFTDRISGGYDGGCFGEKGLTAHEVCSLWADAGNSVQWRAPR